MKCPECDSENLEYEDESFDHEFGKEIIRYYFCNDCDWQEDAEHIER